MAMDASIKEQTIFDHAGNKIITEDREIQIIAKFAEPLIVVLGNVLSDEECDQLIQQSKDRMQRSKVANSLEVDELRTSSSTFFEEGENEFVARIEKRVSQIMNIPVEHGEGLQILNYKIGQEYKAHFDFFSSTSRAASNPRLSTLVMYLNDVEQGGETYFPKLNFSVSPQKGMAVYFEYFYNDQKLNDLTLHGGAPVVIGDKWAATQWMRRKKL
ncbi:2OG-Fe(II) oxygenase [Cytobacillus firmus]|uniref:2OG-Fe(II) oxygenase n=1 Tax=Cytobacillus firmus TaxID=1399 RepID=UPI0018CEE84A|nr:2OG-Fe(II) oxygenase [Cytobacillus firmus]MBG9548153.1 2OG-Fe(II) oxygenase [Cytobacillus firmus]MBG9601666.1 2OG-Fe(II) oxygenase [Cytobacillus firmus]MBG9655332.1 2OG-Fe(II) oxygenase [Cytobacillus firmus]MDD9311700.1 2OG-Fe(II) oxygenase [Cytobacillus firmus]MED1908514.1 2OG-Fe(II) oxygenase [Cytobacillus firmus]